MTRENKIKKTYRLAPDTIKKIEQLADEKGMTLGGVIDYLVLQHFEHESTQNQAMLTTIEGVMQQYLQSIFEPLTEGLNRVRVTSNVIDRNTQMLLEFWNHYFIMTDAKKLGSTQRYKTIPFEEAEALVKERIAHNRQKKLDWEAKRKPSDNQDK